MLPITRLTIDPGSGERPLRLTADGPTLALGPVVIEWSREHPTAHANPARIQFSVLQQGVAPDSAPTRSRLLVGDVWMTAGQIVGCKMRAYAGSLLVAVGWVTDFTMQARPDLTTAGRGRDWELSFTCFDAMAAAAASRVDTTLTPPAGTVHGYPLQRFSQRWTSIRSKVPKAQQTLIGEPGAPMLPAVEGWNEALSMIGVDGPFKRPVLEDLGKAALSALMVLAVSGDQITCQPIPRGVLLRTSWAADTPAPTATELTRSPGPHLIDAAAIEWPEAWTQDPDSNVTTLQFTYTAHRGGGVDAASSSLRQTRVGPREVTIDLDTWLHSPYAGQPQSLVPLGLLQAIMAGNGGYIRPAGRIRIAPSRLPEGLAAALGGAATRSAPPVMAILNAPTWLPAVWIITGGRLTLGGDPDTQRVELDVWPADSAGARTRTIGGYGRPADGRSVTFRQRIPLTIADTAATIAAYDTAADMA